MQHLDFGMFCYKAGENEKWQTLRRQKSTQPYIYIYTHTYIYDTYREQRYIEREGKKREREREKIETIEDRHERQ